MKNAANTTAILFDAGGTLVHLDHGFLWRQLREQGMQVSLRAIRRAEYAAKAEIDRRSLAAVTDSDETRRHPYFATLLDKLAVDEHTAAVLIAQWEAAHARANLWRVMLFSTPHVLAALQERGFSLGVISNADGRIARILQRCGIAHFFSVIIDSYDVGVEKPDPHIFRLALAQMSTPPAQALYIGDIYSIDVVGAQRAGLRSCLLDTLDCYTWVECDKIRHLGELMSVA